MSSEFDFLRQSVRANHLAHGLIMASSELLKTRNVAHKLAQLVLCEQPAEQGCGTCHSCQLFEAGSHPDWLFIEGGGKTETIKVDQVREVSHFLHETASIATYRVVLIENAHNMNQYAQNALLKSLEEPGDNTLLILTTDNAHSLLPTIRSRCQTLQVQSNAQNHFSGQLIDLLKKRATPNEVAKAFESEKLVLIDSLYALMQSHLAEDNGFEGLVSAPKANIKVDAAFAFCDKCLQIKNALKQKITLSPILMIEDLIIDYYRVCKGEGYVVNFVSA